MPVQVGQPAPDFTLFDTEKKEWSLKDLRGENVVILFFPLAFTSVCTKELCSIRDNAALYERLKAKVIAISVDSLFTLGKFKEEQGYKFTMLSDFNKEVSAAYDSLYPSFGFGMKGVSKRAAFVVDKDGIVRYMEVLEDAGKLPDFGKIEALLEEMV